MFLNRLFSIKNLLYLIILILGSWQFGTGTFIFAKAQLAQYLLNNAWNKTIETQKRIKPWNWADTYPVAKISFREHKKEFIVLAGGNGRIMAFGPGHVSATPLPGNKGNSVIVGHRDTHFLILKNLHYGNVIDMQLPNNHFSYKVVNTFIVDHSQTEVMHNHGEELLTLITCYPFNSPHAGGPLRYVVQAVPIHVDNQKSTMTDL